MPGAKGSAEAMGYVMGFLGMTMWLLSGAMAITAIVGACFCLSGPTRHSVRATATALVALTGLVLLASAGASSHMSAAGALGGGDGGPGGGGDVSTLLLFELGRLTVLALLLRAICRSTAQRRTADTAMLLAFLSAPIILGMLGLIRLLLMVVTPSVTIFIVFILMGVLAFAGVVVFGLMLIPQVQRGIERRKLPAD